MKIKYSNFIMAVAALMVTSCTNDEIPRESSNELKMYVTVNDVVTRVDSEAEGTKFLPGDEIWLQTRPDLSVSPHQRIKYSTANGTVDGVAEFVSADSKSFQHNGTVCVYYSLQDCELDDENYPQYLVCKDQSTIDDFRKADFLSGTVENSNVLEQVGSGSRPVELSHIVEKITITIDEYENFDASTLASMTPENVKFYFPSEYEKYYAYIYFNVLLDRGKKEKEFIPIKPLITKDEASGKYSFTVIVPSCEYSKGDTMLSFNMGGLDYVVNAPENINLNNCEHTHFSLKLVGKYAAVIENVSLSDWELISGNKVVAGMW